MNIKNKKMIGNIYFFSFFKRAFICFLCIILCFNVVCKPKKTYAATLGVAVTWGLVDYLAALVASAGIALTVDGFCRGLGLYGGDEEVTEEEALQWCKNNISIDGDNNVVFTDDAKAFINDYLLSDYNDSVTMVYRHPVFKQHMLYENFPTKIVADNFYDLLEGLPDAYVSFLSTTIASYDQENFILSSGETFSCNNRIRAIDLGLIIDGTSGVSTNLDLEASSTTLYNDNWEVCKSYYVYLITPFDGTVDTSVYKYFYYSNSGKYVLCESFDDIVFSDCRYTTAPARSTLLSSSYSCQMSTGFFFNGGSQALNVYKSVDDMKKDLGSQIIGNYIPDYYTGTPDYNITTSEVNNIVNNYYPSDPDDDSGGGSGSGSDDSGGSSSGGSGIIDGLGKLFGAIGNIIDKLFGFVLGLLSKVVDFFGSILEMFTDTLTKLIDIVPAGFNQFLAAMFPYIPEEWITIAEFILLVSAIGCVVALFKK